MGQLPPAPDNYSALKMNIGFLKKAEQLRRCAPSQLPIKAVSFRLGFQWT